MRMTICRYICKFSIIVTLRYGIQAVKNKGFSNIDLYNKTINILSSIILLLEDIGSFTYKIITLLIIRINFLISLNQTFGYN